MIPLAEELLEAPKELILTALEFERSEGAEISDKVGDTICMFLASLCRAEQAIAKRLIRIVKGGLPFPWIDEEKACHRSKSAAVWSSPRVRGQRSVWR